MSTSYYRVKTRLLRIFVQTDVMPTWNCRRFLVRKEKAYISIGLRIGTTLYGIFIGPESL